jgi:hypothetical protein
MNNDRRIATLVGVLYVIGTVAGVASMVIASGIGTGADMLKAVAAHGTQVSLVAFFNLVMAVALAIIPAVVFPVLKRWNEQLAIGYVIFRGALETIAYIGVSLCWLFLSIVAGQSASAGASAASQLSGLGAMLLSGSDSIASIAHIVFSIGGLMFYYVLHQARLLPRWLTIWGIAGLVAFLTAGMMGLFGPEPVPLLLPLGVQEMVMAGWLIAKGFSPSTFSPAHDRKARLGWRAAEVS